ncbi:MAG: SDR family oxidoreductase [Rhodobacteraceae bacterium]|uniref:SDR family NAD(P)-dependent oxidoreductase n=1 Tax=Celeribacter sp. HF31 TaxID=2721558 RepID=UPI001430604F|nr:SDR family oxidoreductase [Celeribacter sp. HF31]NIY81277.1 SDR family oxidoreductase [Celeribacter sp. HF31]NVK47314.1 SDR family oxidoreductase [Paracoccaceae bacterium]
MNSPIVIAGATGGMGAAIALEQLSLGRSVIALGRSAEKLDRLQALADENGRYTQMGELHKCQVEITDPEACRDVAADIIARHGSLGGYVHAAGIGHCGPLMQTSDANWTEAFEIKVNAAARMIRLLMPGFDGAPAASIVLIGGVFAKEPNGLFAINSTLNAAIAGFGKSLSGALRDKGIRVNVLHPGATRTAQWSQLATDASRLLGITADEVTNATAAQLIGNKLLEPGEVASAVSFLLAPANRSMTGTLMVLDGGETKAI